jgi:2-haloacid dehalogenase/putative hydrolase of the HAD superfamily
MARSYDIVTFDCYGTLIDWVSGIRDAFAHAAAEDGVSISGDDAIRLYGEIEPIVERDYRPYQDVLTETAARVAHALGWPIAYERATFLVNSLPSWRPFADTNPALERLRDAGIRLGLLSNIDDDLLAATRRHFTVDFELVITAQQLRSYKPGHAHFLAARQRIGDARWLHAAQSDFHDIVPTNVLGIPNAWINRRHEQALPGGKPGMELADLTGLADAITST